MKTTKKPFAFQNRVLSRNEMKKIIGGVDRQTCDSVYGCPDGQNCVNGYCQGKKSLGTND